MFFIAVNPMDYENGTEETPCDLTKPRITPYKNTWKPRQNTEKLVQFEVRSRERIAILPTHGRLQSSSTTHCLQFALRKVYA